MFWKIIILVLALSGLGLYFSFTLGGLIYLAPAGALIAIVVRRMGKEPNTAFGRWRAPPPRRDKEY